jgi:large subunit ribosomal protein L10
MRKEDKNTIVDSLAHHIQSNKNFYIADISGLNAEKTSKLRRKCFEGNVELIVVKNTLLRKALEKIEGNFEELYDILKDSSSIMLSDSANAPAKLIKDFRKKNKKPILKAAYVEESIYIGDNQLESLATLKSKEELIGDIIGLLQSPAKNVISALQSGKNILAGVVKTLADREEK